jgi:hypothetical protein
VVKTPTARPGRTRAARRSELHKEERLAANELGRPVLRLRAEREGLLDAIWLAACLEAMMAQVYLAVVIARLVGIQAGPPPPVRPGADLDGPGLERDRSKSVPPVHSGY